MAADEVKQSIADAVAGQTQADVERRVTQALASARNRLDDADRAAASGDYGRAVNELGQIVTGLGYLLKDSAEAAYWRGLAEAKDRIVP